MHIDFNEAVQVDSIQSDALFILLVEKDAAFMRLAEDRFYNTYPCIILTAKGQPDVASRYNTYHTVAPPTNLDDFKHYDLHRTVSARMYG